MVLTGCGGSRQWAAAWDNFVGRGQAVANSKKKKQRKKAPKDVKTRIAMRSNGPQKQVKY